MNQANLLYRTRFKLLSVCLLSFASPSRAEEANLPEQYYLQEFPVVLSASRLSQPLEEAPNAMTVIDREMIKASGFRTIADLFRLVPGMYVSYYTGHEPIVAYHGTTDNLARRMQVLVDGRAVQMPPMSSVSWENLPLQIQDIERIEVIRGPAAATYGGNSTQGVINIITRDAGSQQGFQASLTQGNGGISDGYASFGSRGDTLDYRISLGYRSDDGYDPNGNNSRVGNDTLNNDSHLTHLFNLRANYHPNTRDSIDFQLGYTDGSRGDGSNKLVEANLPHDRYDNENFLQVAWLRNLDNGDELKLQYYHIYQDELNIWPPNPSSWLVSLPSLSDNFTDTRDNLELQYTMQTSPSNRLVWGGSTRRDWISAPNRFPGEQSQYQTTLFAHDEWRITPNWLFNTGALQENNGLGQVNLSPRAALIYKFRDHQAVRLGISKAYRNPSLYEERGYYRFDVPSLGTVEIYKANGGLRPESVLSREVGYLGEFAELGFSIDARIYHDQVQDIIYETDPYPKDFVNLFDAEHNGLEITTKHQWGDRNMLTFNYTYEVLYGDFMGYAGSSPYSDTMPRNMISALYSTRFGNDLMLSLGYYQQDTVLPIDRPNTDRQPFTSRWDLRVAKGFKLGSEGTQGEIALVVQGLLGEQYIDYLVENQFNQRVFVTASIRQ
ncbi:MAG TPA: TonB-dependent receptor [Gallionellaceae bacterium]